MTSTVLDNESALDGMTFDWDCNTQSPQIARALSYWRQLRGQHAMPSRNQISPAAIRDILPLVSLYDLLDEGAAYRVRLMGTTVRGAFDKDPTGSIVGPGATHPLALRMLTVFRLVADEHKPVIVRARRTAIEAISFAPIETIFLPLSSDGFTVDTVLATTVTPHFVAN